MTDNAGNEPHAPGGHPTDAAITLPADRLFGNWRDALERVRSYATALGLDSASASELARKAVRAAAVSPPAREPFEPHATSLDHLRRNLLTGNPTAPSPDSFAAWRLGAAVGGDSANATAVADWRQHGPAIPKLARRSMRPHRMRRGVARRSVEADRDPRPDGVPPTADGEPDHRPAGARRRARPWWGVSLRRRLLLGILILLPSVIAANFMIDVLPHQGRTWLEVAIALFFAALFGWISIGFWTALLGFFVLLWRRDRFAITGRHAPPIQVDVPPPRTAIVMPICNEPVDRVFAGLRAIEESLARLPQANHFDFFVLSDTGDPSRWVDEEQAWFRWCRDRDGFGRFFYRRRRVRLERKSGNVADFCRRWGARYRYMIVLDADSIMAGATLVRLVEMMEATPRAAVIQTVPVAVGRSSLFARAQQFASRIYGPMFAAGLHFWQLGDGQYWGHNAIIRAAPFMENCSLPRLPGGPPLGGEILSHDFVEAALLGRTGWELWLAYDLPGSWEDTSSSLLEEMQRDRRWCQGNLQHLRLLRTRGLVGAHRALFLNGVLSYVSAALWFAFLGLSTVEAIWNAVGPTDYFPSGPSLFPEWPIWRPDWALALAAVTAAILFLPKILSIVLALTRGPGAKAFGGVVRLSASVLVEIVLSSLLAPIRMVFHTRFVVTNLLGHTVAWKSSSRADAETGWSEAIRHHGLDTALGAAWGVGVYWLDPGYFWWLTPIVAALVLSIPISVIASRSSVGVRLREAGILRIPEESDPPRELVEAERHLRNAEAWRNDLPPAERDGFVRAVVDPFVNAVHCALLGGASRSLRADIAQQRSELALRAIASGPAALSPAERTVLLYDAQALTALHDDIWADPEPARARAWGRPAGDGSGDAPPPSA